MELEAIETDRAGAGSGTKFWGFSRQHRLITPTNNLPAADFNTSKTQYKNS